MIVTVYGVNTHKSGYVQLDVVSYVRNTVHGACTHVDMNA